MEVLYLRNCVFFFFCSGASNPKLIFGSTLCDGDSYGYEGQNSTMRVEYCCAEIQGDRVVHAWWLYWPTIPDLANNTQCRSQRTLSQHIYISVALDFHESPFSSVCHVLLMRFFPLSFLTPTRNRPRHSKKRPFSFCKPWLWFAFAASSASILLKG